MNYIGKYLGEEILLTRECICSLPKLIKLFSRQEIEYWVYKLITTIETEKV